MTRSSCVRGREAVAVPAAMEAREALQELRAALRAVLARVREGEPGEDRGVSKILRKNVIF